jgi:predicted MFS family arabinose efflux permease
VNVPFSLSTHRWAVLALFALNGWLYSSWAARVPAIIAQYDISDATMGLILITASLGAFLSMPFAAFINKRLGVMKVCLLTSLLYIVILPAIPLFSTPIMLYVIYALMGVAFGLLDVAMNAQAVEVERAYEKPILSSFHAGFSAAMIAGALASSLVIKLGLSFQLHLSLAAVLALALVIYAYPRLYPHLHSEDVPSEADSSAFRIPVRATWLIGAIGFCSMMSEASISDWTAKYMLEIAGSEEFMAPWSLAAFAITMTIGRLFGDRFRSSLGDQLILSGGSSLAFLGMLISLVYPSPFTTILGAAMVGTGLSVAVPIIFSLSGSIPRLSPSAALSMVTSIAYLGLFLGPAVIGLLTEHFDLRVGYGFILLALAMMVVLTWRLERRQQKEAKT